MKHVILNRKGLTLIELMVAMAIAGIVGAAMFAFQHSQTRSYVTQAALTDMQQNARAAMHFMTSELRLAGLDPFSDPETGLGGSGAGIEAASVEMIRFSIDYAGGGNGNGNGNDDENGTSIMDMYKSFRVSNGAIDEPGEDITYELVDGDLVRDDFHGGDPSIIARNIDALDFVYYDEDKDRIPEASLPNRLGDIRSVSVTILVRSGENLPGFMYRHHDGQTYRNREGDVLFTANDNFRRILLSEEVRLRNM